MNNLTIFGLERLEHRVLLAVNISQSGSTLTVTGDGNDEIIHVHDYAGGVRVHVDEDGGGAEDFDATYYGVSNIKINTNGGDDVVYVSYLSISGTLDIKTGAGDDRVRIDGYADYFDSNYGDVSIGKDLKIDTGSGDDRVLVFADDEYYTSIGGKLEIKTQGGDDDVHVYAEDGKTLSVGKDVKIETHGGYDEVRLDAHPGSTVEIDGKVEIKSGADDDSVYVGGEGYVFIGKDLHIDTGGGSSSGDDRVDLFADFGQGAGLLDVDGSVRINTHHGDDGVYIGAQEDGDIDIGKDLHIDTGGDTGEDLVRLDADDYGSYIDVGRHVNIHTHNGDDDVLFIVSDGGEIAVFGRTHIDLGNAGAEGDFLEAWATFGGGGYIDFYDTFQLQQHNGESVVLADEYVTFHDDARFNGGNDYDYIDVFDATVFGDLKIQKFEN
jgi:hypothetical protein